MTRKLTFLAIFAMLALAGVAQAGGDAAAGEAKALDAGCVDCHGEAGEGVDDAPAIAGMPADKHLEMLKGYQSGELEGETMSMMLEGISEQDLADIAAYYAKLGG